MNETPHFKNPLRSLLNHPLTAKISLDDPNTTILRRRIIHEKSFLKQVYQDWYRILLEAIPPGQGIVLELGSGAGFVKEFQSDILTSEVFYCPGVDIVLDAQHIPLSGKSLRGIVMVDVLHHLPNVRRFFCESTRCVISGGVIAMIEPWKTSWSSWVYRRLHHEPFDPLITTWEFPSFGPLSGANGALPWILFERDRTEFEQEFPAWEIEKIQPMMPFRYLVSGGVSTRIGVPGWGYSLIRKLEDSLDRWIEYLGMFAFILLRRTALR